MVMTMAAQAMTQSLVRPLWLCPPSSSHSSSRLRSLASISSTPLLKNHYHDHIGGNGYDNSHGSSYVISNTGSRRPSSLNLHQWFKPVAVLEADLPFIQQWDWWTATFAAVANIPFLLLQLPQIMLNASNLMNGNKSALFAITAEHLKASVKNVTEHAYWFAWEPLTTFVLCQEEGDRSNNSAMLGSDLHWVLIFNFLHYFGVLPCAIWNFWDDFILVSGFSVLAQVIWFTCVPKSVLPGSIAFATALLVVIMSRAGKLSEGGWTATLLFMWMPVSQMWTNLMNPGNIKGLSAVSVLLSMIGNGLMIPRAVFTRDIMWFAGSCWASVLYGWGNLLCLYLFDNFSREFFFSSTAGFRPLFLGAGFTFWKDSRAHGHSNPFRSLKELVVGP
ncbi:hypothetical protein Cgig2_009184 [Carnegiea gigantea]|uniref:Uncharacterized protein n=1 Tax=Carnegiea gigantea TaxID=171969 RepID=A0A9Q1KDZ3_9CARY|nr:hypothetical protein Cgig2_009184 [Carnegiea gigantea]